MIIPKSKRKEELKSSFLNYNNGGYNLQVNGPMFMEGITKSNSDIDLSNLSPMMSQIYKGTEARQENVHFLEIDIDDKKQVKFMSLRDLLVNINNNFEIKSELKEEKNDEDMLFGLLRYRDLRHIGYNFNLFGEPVILIRRQAVLIALDPVRVIVLANRVLLIISDGNNVSPVQQVFERNLQAWDPNKSTSFEKRVYEAIFSTIFTLQIEEFEELELNTLRLLASFKRASVIRIKQSEKLRTIKNKVAAMGAKIISYRQSIKTLLNADDDMSLMNLTLLSKKPHLYVLPLTNEILRTHADIEIILEGYLMDYNFLLSKLEFLRTQIDSTEELVSVRLDIARNYLMIAEVTIAAIAMTMNFGNYIGCLFGMNLVNHHEDDDDTFYWVAGLTSFGMLVIATGIIGGLTYTGVFPRQNRNENGINMENIIQQKQYSPPLR